MAENEADGNAICGWYYLPVFEEQLRAGRVDGTVRPVIATDGAVVTADAGLGFAQPALAAGLPALVAAALKHGIACLAVRRSYNALALGPWVRRLADDGLIGLAFANAPASVAPPGARRAVYGTNPFAVAAPVTGGTPIVLDQSTSAVAKTEVMMRAEAGRPLEPGWAQDAAGDPTTDAAAALGGALLPAGGRKGASLLVEILAAVATGGRLSAKAHALGDAAAPHPSLGQLIVALDPRRTGGGDAGELVAIMRAAGSHVPGQGRAAARRGR